MNLKLYTDGGARGNPGPAGIGIVVKNEDDATLLEIKEFIGTATNNEAEYKGLIAGLQKCIELSATQVSVFMDSELVVKQLTKVYRVKEPRMLELYNYVQNLLPKFEHISFTHVKRALNKEADALVNQALDER